ncbi:S9 family peptidase [Roseisolibacter agri]|uniref:S9 family peptidase n=1 Tax=Roseisolibacter agri TaxID=2014610 RepID=UPI0024E13C88|nr:prolyl oligopeptidase family serine peptidase [Roseisolibacter agri]
MPFPRPRRSAWARAAAAAAALTPAAFPLVAPARLPAQGPARPATAAPTGAGRALTQTEYDTWRGVQGTTLSRDGRWLAYQIGPVVGDGELVVRGTSAATEYRVPRGYTGRPQLTPNADSGFTAPPPVFSADGRIVAAMTYAPRAEFERARARRGSQPPRATLAMLSLADGKVTSVPRVRSFQMPRETGGWIAYLMEPADSAGRAAAANAARDSSARPAGAAATSPGGTPRPIAADSAARRERRKENGTTLVVRNLATGEETRIDDVVSYAFADSGRWLAYTTSSRTPARDGAWVRTLGPTGLGDETALASGRGNYRALTFDRGGRQVAFVTDRDAYTADKPTYTLFHARLDGRAPAARAIVTPAGIERGLVVSERGVSFVRDGSALVLGLAPAPLDSIPADSLADKAVLDLWHFRDLRLQPQQRLEAGRERGRAYTAVYTLGTGRLVRLGNDTLQQIQVSDDGRAALAVTGIPYAISQMWGEGGSDVWALDPRTGARRAVATKVPFQAQLSPGGNFAVFYQDRRWKTFDLRTGRTTDLTGALTNVRFDQETWDTPSDPAPWGVAGWTNGDRSLLVNSRYDVWELDPEGKRAPRVVTDSIGVRSRTVFRLVDLDREDRFINPAQPLLLSAFQDSTKAAGFYRDRLGATAAPERIVMADARFGQPLKARDAEVYAVTRQTYTESPDVWVGTRLDQLSKVTDANPQQAQYAWGNVELVTWRSDDGQQLQGLLYKPESFDASKKYPMVVYFYESLSDNLHQYHTPSGRNVINPVVYASNGYLVFFPDIAYTDGFPGRSAMQSIVPGVQSLIGRGYVDAKHIGIGGQSWGGYQSAYMITQTPLFAAAFLGAPVANMTSAYGGIRWESGVARAFQYEKGQSRIGKSIWDAPLRYIENSPLFYMDKVTTPMLIMSNDADGAVPWYQGIEMFVAARRFGKEAYLLNYNGDGHNPRKRANQLDVDRRMQQFFAHHLKGEPAPDWMRNGIPFLQKGRDQLQPPAAVPAVGGAATSQSSAP